ncbi:MAG: DUF1643 domain-containing protein, partial [Calditrichaeota bacterium]|nr:DUF1643 domain-containing protein [Calditrichota bacterium]
MIITGSGARFSRDRRYRYALWRTWADGNDSVLFIGLNPSQADEKENDPTIRRCISFAQDWGFSGCIVVNLFAYCTAYPGELKTIADPIGPRT